MTNKSYIENIINQANNQEELKGVFSDHFDSLTKPVSVSLGLYLRDESIEDVVGMLRKSGIDAVPYYDPKVKDNFSCFVVDGTGVRSPVLIPEDAIKATADIFEIMQQNNIATSRALPVGQENLIPAIAKVYESKIIDIAGNNPNEANLNEFLSSQLKLATEEMEQINLNANNDENGKTYLYRGGTLGDKPYALTFHRRKRDAAYATKDFAMAVTYADGIKGAGLRYEEVSGQSYGFIYKFEEHKGQRYYDMAGIENPRGSEECINHPDNKDDYETLIVQDRNPLKGIYLKVKDKVVQIADESGYTSENWEKFAKLHTPYNTNEKNDYMVARMNRQIADFHAVPYTSLGYDDKSFNPEIYGLTFGNSIKEISDTNSKYNYELNNAEISSVKLPKDASGIRFTGDFYLDNCSLPPKMDTLNLSKCSGVVGISGCDLSSVEKIVLPEDCNVFFLSNVNLPKGGTLDFSHMKCKSMTFEDQDFSNLEIMKFPKDTNIKFKGKTALPEHLSVENLDMKAKLAGVREKIQTKNNSSAKQQNIDIINEHRGLSLPTPARAPYKPQKMNVDIRALKMYQENKINNN